MERAARQPRVRILLLYRCSSHLVSLGISLTVSIRNPVLYPPELRGQIAKSSIYEIDTRHAKIIGAPYEIVTLAFSWRRRLALPL